jgi:hypothetical protein
MLRFLPNKVITPHELTDHGYCEYGHYNYMMVKLCSTRVVEVAALGVYIGWIWMLTPK